jgi:hypothetical protein
MFDLLASIFDPDYDYKNGRAAAHDAGLLAQILFDVLPFGSEGFEAGYEDGLADRKYSRFPV